MRRIFQMCPLLFAFFRPAFQTGTRLVLSLMKGRNFGICRLTQQLASGQIRAWAVSGLAAVLLELSGMQIKLSLFTVLTSVALAFSSVAQAGMVTEKQVSQLDSRVIARTLVERVKAKDLSRKIEAGQPTFDFQSRTQIVIAFQFQYFQSILKNGFLNQFQVDHSANLDRKHRMLVEDRMLGSRIPRSNDPVSAVQQLRPKYAYVGLDIDAKDPRFETMFGSFGTIINERYGNVFAKLKDQVKDRSTLTAGDSLLVLGSKRGDARSFATTQTSPVEVNPYFEAQIWGELTANDIDYVLVNCEGSDFKQTLSETQIQALKTSGLAVYQCQPRTRFGRGYGSAFYLDRGPAL